MNFIRAGSFLFLLFANLYDSFKMVNMNRMISHTRLSMGCDYYIEHNLCIYYNDNTTNCINLQRDRGYYYDNYDSYIINTQNQDAELSEWEKLKKYQLTPRIVPTVIYTNHSFTNTYVSNQYKEILEYEMINNDYKTWDDIKDIVIMEERYERD